LLGVARRRQPLITSLSRIRLFQTINVLFDNDVHRWWTPHLVLAEVFEESVAYFADFDYIFARLNRFHAESLLLMCSGGGDGDPFVPHRGKVIVHP